MCTKQRLHGYPLTHQAKNKEMPFTNKVLRAQIDALEKQTTLQDQLLKLFSNGVSSTGQQLGILGQLNAELDRQLSLLEKTNDDYDDDVDFGPENTVLRTRVDMMRKYCQKQAELINVSQNQAISTMATLLEQQRNFGAALKAHEEMARKVQQCTQDMEDDDDDDE